MKKIILFISLITIVDYGYSQGTWSPKANFGGINREGATGFSIGTKGYVGTGWGSNYLNDFWEFDPINNIWSQKADFGGVARREAVGFSIGSKGYIGTGSSSDWPATVHKDFWEYDPNNNNWIQKTDFPGTARAGAVGFSIGAKGYIGTGNDGSNRKDFWEYDQTTNIWLQKADFGGTARNDAVGFSIGTKGFIGTGMVGFAPSKDFWEYDQTTNIWTQKSDFGGTARSNAIGFSLGTKGFIGTGYNYPNSFKDFWEYNPADDTWIQKANFGGIARMNAVGFSINQNGYIGTGWQNGGNPFSDFWEYDTNSDACIWTRKSDFPLGTYGGQEAVGFSIGLKGYIGTGDGPGAGNYLNDFWEYDIGNNTWTQKSNFGGVARSTAVGFSIGAKGYIGTGSDGTMNPLKQDFWEWDQATNTWVQKADFGGTGRNGAVGFSIDNKGYVGTGWDGTYRKDFWEYDPINNIWTQKADFGGTARFFAVGFSIGQKGYLGTGWDMDSLRSDFWQYDPGGNVWYQKANFKGIARYGAVSFPIGSKGYVGTGVGTSSSIALRDFWEYDSNLNIWVQKTDYSSATSGDVSFSIGSKGFIKNAYGMLWEYDPTLDPSPIICLVTVDSLSKNNVIVWDKSLWINTNVDSFIVFRDTSNNKFAPIGAVPFNSLSQFIDTVRTLYSANGDPQSSSWRYKLAIKDFCGNITPMSPYHQSIFISNVFGNFFWNQYQIENQTIPVPGLNSYLFQRDDSSTGNWQTIPGGTLSASSQAYTDGQFGNFTNPSYRVMTDWSTKCTATKSTVDYNSSRSNVKSLAPPGSVNEHSIENAISIYPNPNDGTFELRITNVSEFMNCELKIHNILGALIYSEKFQNHPHNAVGTEIRISKIPKGIYNLQIENEKINLNKKLIIE